MLKELITSLQTRQVQDKEPACLLKIRELRVGYNLQSISGFVNAIRWKGGGGVWPKFVKFHYRIYSISSGPRVKVALEY